VTGGTEDDEVPDVVVAPIAVDVTNLQDIRNAKAAVRTNGRVVLEGQLAVVDSLHTWT
jgi:hypothetical protein